MSRIFLYKLKDSDDRDCCAYIDNDPERFECEHYFGGVILHGSCYSGHEFAAYEDVKTYLSKSEYERLVQFSKDINDLGYGIKRGDERYLKGLQLCANIRDVYRKLNCVEAEEFFDEIWEEEKEYLMEEYNLDEDEIEEIFDNYTLEYRDRSVVSAVFDDVSDFGYEEAWSLGYIKNGDSIAEKYFDYERFGEDVADDEYHHKLPDGRVVCLSY